MGIRGLPSILPLQKTYLKSKDLMGKRAAVDALCWIYACVNRFPGRSVADTSPIEISTYFVENVTKLRVAGMTVTLVFEGAFLRSWRNFEKPAKFKNDEYHASGNLNEKRFTDLAYEILEKLNNLHDENVSCLGAPNEADAQLAYLATNGFADVVITKDTDLIAYGCPWILFELCLDTWSCTEFHRHAMIRKYARGLNDHQILQAMLLTGCDYIECLPVRENNFLTFISAVKLIRLHQDYSGVIQALRLPLDYKRRFENAIHIFLHQKVYSVRDRMIDYLKPINANGMCDQYLWFLGERIDQMTGTDISEMKRYPYSPHDFIKKYEEAVIHDAIGGVDDQVWNEPFSFYAAHDRS